MKLSHSLGMTACVALLATSGFASAVTTIWGVDGYIEKATDGTATCAAFQQTVGHHEVLQVYAPGTGLTGLTFTTSGTSPTSTTSNSTVTYSCVSGTAQPASLNGQTMAFSCYADTMSGPGSSAILGLTQKFRTKTVGANGVSNPNVMDVEVTTIFLGPGFTTACTTVEDLTWIKQ